MVKLINRTTGGEMWVHESRLQEYLAAGHKPAADTATAPPPASEEEKGKTAKTGRKRRKE